MHEIVKLFVIQATASQSLLAPAFGMVQPGAQTVDRIHGAGVVDVIGGNQRSIQRTGPRSMEQLKYETALIGVPVENPVDPEILRADVRAEILPLGVVGVGGRFHRIRPNVTEGARHSHAIGLYQVFVPVKLGIIVVGPAVAPLFCCRFIKVGIREKSQPDDARRIAVIGAQRKILTPRANGNTRILLLVLKGIGRTVGSGATLVQPQAIALRVGTSGFVEARLVDEPEIFPTIMAALLLAPLLWSLVRRKRFQQNPMTKASLRNLNPQTRAFPSPIHTC